MLRKSFVAALVLAAFALALPQIVSAAWTFTSPASGANHTQSMTLVAWGTGEGASATLYLGVWRAGSELNGGLGSYTDMIPNGWSGGVSAPSGGFGAGQGDTLRVWRLGDQPTGQPVCEQTINCIN